MEIAFCKLHRALHRADCRKLQPMELRLGRGCSVAGDVSLPGAKNSED